MMWGWITCGRYVLCVKPLWFDQPSPTTSIYHFVLIAFPLSLHPMSELEVKEGKKLIQLEIQNSNGATAQIQIETMKWEWETTGLCSGACALRMIGAVATSKSIRFEVSCDTWITPRKRERERIIHRLLRTAVSIFSSSSSSNVLSPTVSMSSLSKSKWINRQSFV